MVAAARLKNPSKLIALDLLDWKVRDWEERGNFKVRGKGNGEGGGEEREGREEGEGRGK
jgi:hypothetical protein